jgi:hypothetical protein
MIDPPAILTRAKEFEAARSKATIGPWSLWTSNSWRRICNDRGKFVVEPIVYSERDRHPDLRISKEDMAFIAQARSYSPLADIEALVGEIQGRDAMISGLQKQLHKLKAALNHRGVVLECPYCMMPEMDCYYDQTCPGCVERMGANR